MHRGNAGNEKVGTEEMKGETGERKDSRIYIPLVRLARASGSPRRAGALNPFGKMCRYGIASCTYMYTVRTYTERARVVTSPFTKLPGTFFETTNTGKQTRARPPNSPYISQTTQD